MKNEAARQLAEQLKAVLDRLKVIAKDERSRRGSDTEALDSAVVNVDSAIEILIE